MAAVAVSAAAASAAAAVRSAAAAPRGAGVLMKPSDHERVRAAVAAAEARTSGEIVCVLARQSGDYWETPLAWAGVAALIAPIIALIAGARPAMITELLGEWTAAHAAAVDQ